MCPSLVHEAEYPHVQFGPWLLALSRLQRTSAFRPLQEKRGSRDRPTGAIPAAPRRRDAVSAEPTFIAWCGLRQFGLRADFGTGAAKCDMMCCQCWVPMWEGVADR